MLDRGRYRNARPIIDGYKHLNRTRGHVHLHFITVYRHRRDYGSSNRYNGGHIYLYKPGSLPYSWNTRYRDSDIGAVSHLNSLCNHLLRCTRRQPLLRLYPLSGV